jgi:hypothetical protein
VDNSLSTPKLVKKSPEILTNEISPISQEKFLLNSPSKKSDQLKTNQPLPLTANKEQKPTEKEFILLQKIKHLESSLKTYQTKLRETQMEVAEALQNKGELKEQLKQITTERDNLKQLVQQEKQRADNYQQQLKIVIKSLYQ